MGKEVKLTPHQVKEYAKLMEQFEAVCVMAGAGFPRNDHMRVETSGGPPSASMDTHYSFFKFLANAGRAALEVNRE